MSSRAPASTRSTRRTSCRRHSRPAGDRLRIGTIPSSAWQPGTGRRTERGAMRPTRAGTSPAAANSKNRFATFFPTRCPIVDSPPAATVRCKAPTSAIGRAIRISPANSRERATRCTRNGWSWTCGRRSRSARSASRGPVRMPRPIRCSTGWGRTALDFDRGPQGEWKTFPAGSASRMPRAEQ